MSAAGIGIVAVAASFGPAVVTAHATTSAWTQVSAWCRSTADGVGCVAVDRNGTQSRARFSLKAAAGHTLKPVAYNELVPQEGDADQKFCSTGCAGVRSWSTTKPLGSYRVVEKFVYVQATGTQTIYTGSTAYTGTYTTCANTPAGKICAGDRYAIVASKGVGYDSFVAATSVHPTGGRWIAPVTVRLYDGTTTFYSGSYCQPHCARHTSTWSWASKPVLVSFSAFPKTNTPVQTAFKVSAYGTFRTVVGG